MCWYGNADTLSIVKLSCWGITLKIITQLCSQWPRLHFGYNEAGEWACKRTAVRKVTKFKSRFSFRCPCEPKPIPHHRVCVCVCLCVYTSIKHVVQCTLYYYYYRGNVLHFILVGQGVAGNNGCFVRTSVCLSLFVCLFIRPSAILLDVHIIGIHELIL